MTTAYYVLVLLIGLQRLTELRTSNRNAKWALARGGLEFGRRHFVAMGVLHTAFLLGCLAEVAFLDRPFRPALAAVMIATLLLSQSIRLWCQRTLGRRWNTRVIVVPGLRRIRTGPYRWFPHPNYVAVVLEGIAIPMIHGAWITATVFTVANAVLLSVRIRCEERALAAHYE